MKLDQLTNTTYHLIKGIIKNTPWDGIVYVAGGFVRDAVMGCESKDIDLLVDKPNGGIEFANWFCETKSLSKAVIFERFGTAKFVFNGEDIECVAPRSETYDSTSRKPTVTAGSLYDDVMRRDFTINTLLLNVSTDEVLDLTGSGLNDIKTGVIQTSGHPNVIFFDDPLRILRAVRQASKFGFTITENTKIGIVDNAFRLNTGDNANGCPISVERIADELAKMLTLPKPSKSIELLKELGVLGYILPELLECVGCEQNDYHKDDVYYHILEVLDETIQNLPNRLAALLHDIAKPKCKTIKDGKIHFYNHEFESAKMAEIILKRLKFSNDIIESVCFAIKNHMRTKSFGDNCQNVKEKSVIKLFDDLGKHAKITLELIDADNVSHHPNHCIYGQWDSLWGKLESLNLRYPHLFKDGKMQLPVNGDMLMQHFSIPPSSLIKDMLVLVRKNVYAKPCLTEEEAYKLCVNCLKNPKKKC